MASSGGDGTIEIPVIATDTATATLTKITQQLDALTKAQEKQTAATAQAVTTGTLWATAYTKAADLVWNSLKKVGGAFEETLSNAIKFGDEINGISKKTGLAVEEIQALKYAGEQAGIGFAAISSAAKRLEVSLAKGGTKTLKQGLTDLKLSAADAAGPGGMEKIIDSLAKITDESERAAAATKLFGRSGPEIARVAEELAKAAEQAKEFGLVVSEDMIAALSQTNDIIERMKQQFEAVGQKFAGAILSSGALQTAMEVLSEIIADLSKFFDENSATITQWTNNAIVFAADAIAKYLVPAILGVIDTFQFMGLTLDAIVLGFNILVIGINAVGQALYALANGDVEGAFKAISDATDKANAEIEKYKVKVWEVVAANSALHDKAAAVQVKLEGYAKRIREGAQENVKAKKAVEDHTAAMDDGGKAAEKFAESVKKLASEITEEGKQLERLKGIAVVNGLITKMGGVAKITLQDLSNLTTELRKYGDEGKQVAQNITSEFEKAGVQILQTSDRFNKSLSTLLSTKGGTTSKSDEIQKKVDEIAASTKKAAHETEIMKAAMDQAFKEGSISAAAYDEFLKQQGILTEEATAKTDDLGKAVAIVNDFMQILGVSAESTLGKIAGLATSVSSLIGKLKADGGIGKAFGDIKGGLSKGLSGILGSVGKAIPYVGIAVGIGKAISGILSSLKLKKQAKDAGKALGTEVSKELAKSIAEQAKKLKIPFKSAALLNITKAIEESGKDARTFGKPIDDLITGIANKSIPAAEGMAQLADAFDKVTESAEKAGVVGDKTTRQIIARAKATGTLTKNMKEFQKANVELAAKGVGQAFPNISAKTEEQGKAQGLIFSTSFFAAVKEVGLVEAADLFRESFDKLHDDLSDKFGPEFAQSVLGPVADILNLTAEGTPFRAAAEGAKGLTDALTGIANAGYLTQEAFNAFGVSAKNAYDQAIEGGATADQAIQAILPLLQAQVSAAEEYGFQLDANTQALVDQATQAGYTFKKDPILQMADAMTKVAVALDKAFHLGLDFGKAMDGAADAANRTADAVASIPNTGGGGGPAPNGPGPPEPHFAEGGYVPPRPGGTRVVVGEASEGEYIVPESKMGPQSISIDYAIKVDANGLSKAEAVEAIKEAMKNGDRGLVLQLQKTAQGRR